MDIEAIVICLEIFIYRGSLCETSTFPIYFIANIGQNTDALLM